MAIACRRSRLHPTQYVQGFNWNFTHAIPTQYMDAVPHTVQGCSQDPVHAIPTHGTGVQSGPRARNPHTRYRGAVRTPCTQSPHTVQGCSQDTGNLRPGYYKSMHKLQQLLQLPCIIACTCNILTSTSVISSSFYHKNSLCTVEIKG